MDKRRLASCSRSFSSWLFRFLGICKMAGKEEESFMTPRHLSAFGAIVHLFARHELLIVGGLSHLTNCDGGLLMHLTAEMPYRAKKDAFMALLRTGAQLTKQPVLANFSGKVISTTICATPLHTMVGNPAFAPEVSSPFHWASEVGQPRSWAYRMTNPNTPRTT